MSAQQQAIEHPAYEKLRPVTEFASVILCKNPGAMELDGTNTWVLRAPGNTECVIVDPGPKGHPKHLKKLAAQGDVALTLITHHHFDHTGSIKKFRKLTGSPVRAVREKHTKGAQTLSPGEVIEAAGLRITVIATPGHTDDSVSFLVEHGDDRAVLTGDTILGRGTTVIDPQGGTLADYMRSLDTLIELGPGLTLLPAHGPDHPDLLPVVQFYKQHREERIEQVRSALTKLGVTAAEAKPMKVVRKVYSDVDKKLWPAARMSVKAQLKYLREVG